MNARDSLSPKQFGDYSLTHSTEDQGERKPRHVITATDKAGTKVGELNWYGTTGTVHHIGVEEEHGRHGIATAMWEMAQDASPRPKHSGDRTSMGDCWSKKVGRRRPRLNRSYEREL